jgi:hypothetical protein
LFFAVGCVVGAAPLKPDPPPSPLPLGKLHPLYNAIKHSKQSQKAPYTLSITHSYVYGLILPIKGLVPLNYFSILKFEKEVTQ